MWKGIVFVWINTTRLPFGQAQRSSAWFASAKFQRKLNNAIRPPGSSHSHRPFPEDPFWLLLPLLCPQHIPFIVCREGIHSFYTAGQCLHSWEVAEGQSSFLSYQPLDDRVYLPSLWCSCCHTFHSLHEEIWKILTQQPMEETRYHQ